MTTHKFSAPLGGIIIPPLGISKITINNFLPYIAANSGTKSILLVDPSFEKSTITLKDTLVQYGHRVTHVQYRHEAVVYLLQGQYSLILVNVFDNKLSQIEDRCSDRKLLDDYAKIFNIPILHLHECRYMN